MIFVANWRSLPFGESYILTFCGLGRGTLEGSEFLGGWILKFTTKMGIRIIRNRSKGYKDKEAEFVIDNRLTKYFVLNYTWIPCVSNCVIANHYWRIFRMQKWRKKWRKWVCDWCLSKWFSKRNLVWHMPCNISKFAYKFLKLPNSKLSCKVKGKRLNRGAGYGLEIPVIYAFNGHEKTFEWIKELKRKCL